MLIDEWVSEPLIEPNTAAETVPGLRLVLDFLKNMLNPIHR